MVFSSNVFLFLFLPLFLAVYYLTPDRGRLRNLVVLLGSWLFYAWWRVDFLLLFIAVTAFNYLVGRGIGRNLARRRVARRYLLLGVTLNLAVLAYFKYANFGVTAFNDLFEALGLQPLSFAWVLLPIGISFYIFESISYIVDVYRGDAQMARHPVDFATFVALFPHLIAGPVFRYKDLEEQFQQRRHSLELFGQGVLRFMQGFIKKVFIADSIAPLVQHAFALPAPSTADAWLGALAYTVQLYFDFSGYSDMAIGLGLMMGFRFMENFNQPYVSQSITEFWRRWHMSLSSWLRDYLYIALGGNRGGTLKTYRNLFLTMLLGGFWHGANWTFLAWGAWHGLALCVERALHLGTAVRSSTQPTPPFQPLRWLITLLIVVLGWVMFRADHVGSAWNFYRVMFTPDGAGFSQSYASAITRLQLATLALAVLVLIWRGAASLRGPSTVAALPWRLSLSRAGHWLLWPMFGLAVLKLSAQSYSPFLYFQF